MIKFVEFETINKEKIQVNIYNILAVKPYTYITKKHDYDQEVYGFSTQYYYNYNCTLIIGSDKDKGIVIHEKHEDVMKKIMDAYDID